MLPLQTLQRQQHVAPVNDIAELQGNAEDGEDFGPFMEAINSARRGDQVKYVVVDTDVFSLLFRGQDVDLYRRHLDGTVPVLSFVSVAELHYGATYAG